MQICNAQSGEKTCPWEPASQKRCYGDASPDPWDACEEGACGAGWCTAALSSFQSYPLCKCSPVDPYGPVPLSGWPQEECTDYGACGYGGYFEFHECDSGKDHAGSSAKENYGKCTYDYVFNNNLSGMFADQNRFSKWDLGANMGDKELSVKFPGQADSKATQVRVVDTSYDVVSPYINGSDGQPLPFQLDLEYWTAMKLIPWDIEEHGSMTKGEYVANKAINPLFGRFAHTTCGSNTYTMADPAVDVGVSGKPLLGATLDSTPSQYNTICIKRPGSKD